MKDKEIMAILERQEAKYLDAYEEERRYGTTHSAGKAYGQYMAAKQIKDLVQKAIEAKKEP